MTYLYWAVGAIAAAGVVKLLSVLLYEASFLGQYLGSSGRRRDLIVERDRRRMRKLPPMTDDEEIEFLCPSLGKEKWHNLMMELIQEKERIEEGCKAARQRQLIESAELLDY